MKAIYLAEHLVAMSVPYLADWMAEHLADKMAYQLVVWMAV